MLVAIIESKDCEERKAVIVPPGQALAGAEDGFEEKWILPYLPVGWHLAEFLEVVDCP